ncbi:ABC transporter substrate-binding protein [Methylobacterium sp. E-041]|jgi:TRAP-type mannitol/chloroaromatic compound transport system substrate-binding protein|uniref:TRAP transporter substrate-binding protein n=1 Tax=unclassified Methylobacterium TaxID=2615210 RepID=UPI0011C6F61D|nr:MULTISPECIES: ABC transporter substrate-binding protein [unclassified Methylobacterium]MCJ2041574.1 ABC transporter substrate-binding protein [Methylobacterium sp. J-059]MCJ2079120.1 ABC transporter substrate-binding protein [Methylobacterium sp. E-016]MCJ2105714.1 ABC transporter substrate-binding protein [Methylobacterium sp. E-041]TXM94575.1 ABC transporter substrate-binding protein [Methylobacterium sp. WL116]TXN38761.1 ABC transporter substrate-binding protein [Methylobacterium sp. WL9
MTTVKRRALLTAGLGAALASPALASPALAATPAQGGPEVRWRLASAFPKNLDILFGASETLARIVGEATDGRFAIQVTGPGEPVPADGLLDAVAAGTVEMGHGPATVAAGKDPTLALATALPFGLNARGQNAWWLAGGANDLFADLLAKNGLASLPGGNTGAQMGGWFRREIKTVADLQGLKIRIGGLGAQVLAKLGAVPQAVPGPEIAAALEAKRLDAAEWIGPYDDERLGLQKAAPIYHYPGFWEGGAMLHFWLNAETWKALPKPYRAILQAASAEVAADVQAKYDARNPGALRRLVATGAQLRPFPQDVMEAALKAANDVYAEIAGKNPDFRRIYEAMKTFRNEEYLWFQVAEYTYDNFMIRARARG